MLRRPGWWVDGREFTHARPIKKKDDPWVIAEFDDLELRVHPAHLVPPEYLEIYGLWAAHRGGMGGAGPLPDPGALLQQPALLMDAFDIIGGADGALSKTEKD